MPEGNFYAVLKDKDSYIAEQYTVYHLSALGSGFMLWGLRKYTEMIC